jgi:hypothetical protein
MANNGYQIEDLSCSEAELRRAVAIARGMASASGRRSNRSSQEAERAGQQLRRRARRKAAEDDAHERFEAAVRRRVAASLQQADRDRRMLEAAIHVRRLEPERRLPGFDRHKPLPMPRGSMHSGWATPTADMDGYCNLVLKLWTHGAGKGSSVRPDAMARKARYVIDPAALAGPAEEVVLTNMIAPGAHAPAPGTRAFEAEVVACCRAIQELEEAVARREKGSPRVQLFKHGMVALPAGLSHGGRVRVAQEIVRRLEDARLPYVAMIQGPSRQRGAQDPRNFHLQLIVSTRPFQVTGPRSWAFAPIKDQETLGPEGLRQWRHEIVAAFNAALEAEGLRARYTALTRAERGLFGRPRPAVQQVPVHTQLEALADRFGALAEASDRLSRLRARTAAATARIAAAQAAARTRAEVTRIRQRLQERLTPVLAARTRLQDMHVRALLDWAKMRTLWAVTEVSTKLEQSSGRLTTAAHAMLQDKGQTLAALGDRMETGLLEAFRRHREQLMEQPMRRRTRLTQLEVGRRLDAVRAKRSQALERVRRTQEAERARALAQAALDRAATAMTSRRRLEALRVAGRLGQTSSRRQDAETGLAALEVARERLRTAIRFRVRLKDLKLPERLPLVEAQRAQALDEARRAREAERVRALVQEAETAMAALGPVRARLATADGARERMQGLGVSERLEAVEAQRAQALEKAAKERAAADALDRVAAARAAWDRLHALRVLDRLREASERLDREEEEALRQCREAETARERAVEGSQESPDEERPFPQEDGGPAAGPASSGGPGDGRAWPAMLPAKWAAWLAQRNGKSR